MEDIVSLARVLTSCAKLFAILPFNLPQVGRLKRKEKTMPFGVNLTRSYSGLPRREPLVGAAEYSCVFPVRM